MEYLSSEHVHKNFKMNMIFLFLIEVHISSICDSDVLYEVFKFYLTEQTFIWWEQRPKLESDAKGLYLAYVVLTKRQTVHLGAAN